MKTLLFMIASQIALVSAAHACPPPEITVNDDANLTASSMCDSQYNCKSPKDFVIGKTIVAINKAKQVTHEVRVLAIDEDDGGIKSTTYKIEAIGGVSKKVKVYSNYQGGGATGKGFARGAAPQAPADTIEVKTCGLKTTFDAL